MFGIRPRMSDDLGFFSLLDCMAADPYNRYHQRNLLPVQFRDGTMGHIGGQVGESQVSDSFPFLDLFIIFS